MKALALLTLLSFSAFAADPIDTPKASVMIAGDIAKEAGVFLPESLAIEQAKRVKKCESERAELQKTDSTPALIIGAVVFLGLGIAAGYGVAQIKR